MVVVEDALRNAQRSPQRIHLKVVLKEDVEDPESKNWIISHFKNVIFECCDFKTSLTKVEPHDFVYLDPPYAPEKDTSFVGYTKNGFNLDDHNNLFELINYLADVGLVREKFINERYNIDSILCKRSINSKKPGSKAKEVIITNYSFSYL